VSHVCTTVVSSIHPFTISATSAQSLKEQELALKESGKKIKLKKIIIENIFFIN